MNSDHIWPKIVTEHHATSTLNDFYQKAFREQGKSLNASAVLMQLNWTGCGCAEQSWTFSVWWAWKILRMHSIVTNTKVRALWLQLLALHTQPLQSSGNAASCSLHPAQEWSHSKLPRELHIPAEPNTAGNLPAQQLQWWESPQWALRSHIFNSVPQGAMAGAAAQFCTQYPSVIPTWRTAAAPWMSCSHPLSGWNVALLNYSRLLIKSLGCFS